VRVKSCLRVAASYTQALRFSTDNLLLTVMPKQRTEKTYKLLLAQKLYIRIQCLNVTRRLFSSPRFSRFDVRLPINAGVFFAALIRFFAKQSHDYAHPCLQIAANCAQATFSKLLQKPTFTKILQTYARKPTYKIAQSWQKFANCCAALSRLCALQPTRKYFQQKLLRVNAQHRKIQS
jgi:hypothetical protein